MVDSNWELGVSSLVDFGRLWVCVCFGEVGFAIVGLYVVCELSSVMVFDCKAL